MEIENIPYAWNFKVIQDMLDISIIVVNYNVKEFVLNLISSLKKALVNFEYEIIIIDNNSQDGSVELISEKYPDIKLIANKINVGFGSANNQGMEIAKGRFYCLINPDTIVKEDTFSKLFEFFDKTPDAGMAGCKVLNPNGTLQLACRRGFPGPWTSFTKVTGLSAFFPKSKLFANYNLTYLDENQTYEVDAISGAFMMLKREVYIKNGGFDTTFFMYGEDLDLCYRVQKSGYKVYYVHTTEIIHYKGESTKRSSIDETKMFYEAMQIFVKKHMSASLIVQLILQTAIYLRKLVAFTYIYKTVIFAVSVDFCFYSFGVYFAEYVYRNDHWIGFPNEYKPIIYFVPAIVQILISALSGAYKKNSFLILRSWLGLISGLFVITTLTFFLKQFAFSRAVVLITFFLSIISFPLWRIILKVFFRIGVGSSHNKIRTLIVGTGDKAVELGNKLKSNISLLNVVVGFVGLTTKEIGLKKGSFSVIASIENIKKTIIENKIEKVIFLSEDISFEQIFSVVSQCQNINVDFLVSGQEHDYLVGKSSVTVLEDIPLLKVNYNISSSLHKITKSLFDFILGISILFSIFPFLYLLFKITGKKTLFNSFVLEVPKVVSGKKSFVGPNNKSFYAGLYLGKPALTGLWFTELFDQSDSKEVDKLNLFYAKNQNIWLDLEILGKTFTKIFIKME
ncbi:MAG: glycosyltransferase [bacterium]